MTRRLGVGAAVALLLGAGVARASAQDRGLDVLLGATQRYADVRTLCADFTQRLEVPLLGDDRSGRGRLCQQSPNLFGMRFSDPAGDLLVVDGTSVWYFTPSSDPRQAFRFPASAGTGGRDFHREFLESPRTKYDVTYQGEEALEGARTHKLRLVPKARASYRAATLWIEDGSSLLRRIRLEEENGNVRTITLSGIVFNAPVEPAFFTFTPPSGVLVIER